MNGLFYRRRKIADILEEILNSYLRPKICRFEIDEQRVSPLDSTIYFERRIGNAVPSTTISICSEGKERGEREEFWREECRKARIEFREQTSTIVVVVVVYFYAYARARARLQVHDRKLNTVEGPWQTRSSATLGESGQRRPLYRQLAKASSTLAESVIRCVQKERERERTRNIAR